MAKLDWDLVTINGHVFDCGELMAEAIDYKPSILELKVAKNHHIVKTINAVASDLDRKKYPVVFDCEFDFTDDYEYPVMPVKILVKK